MPLTTASVIVDYKRLELRPMAEQQAIMREVSQPVGIESRGG